MSDFDMSDSDLPPDFDLYEDLAERGLVADQTPELESALKPSAPPVTLYFGIDPTSDSLHLGSLLGVIMMQRFLRAGHRCLAMIGGATGMVGDPSGRSKERNLLDGEMLEHNFQSIRGQVQALTDIPEEDFFDNREWWSQMGVLDFLRDVGKHVTVNQMTAKESIKTRMDGTEGISFTEFSYMLLQSYDFYWFNANRGCTLQIGGSDQWGNITAGVDLIRRISGNTAHGLTWPLVERDDGQKFGKTADGAVWLDKNKTTPFAFYQYLFNLDDKSAEQLLFWMTLDSPQDLAELIKKHAQKPEARQAQEYLAGAVTSYVHGEKAAQDSKSAAHVFFGNETPDASQLDALRGNVPETAIAASELEGEEALVLLLVKSQLCSSKGDARRQLKQGAVSVNGTKTQAPDLGSVQPIADKYLLISRGKRQKHLIVIQP